MDFLKCSLLPAVLESMIKAIPRRAGNNAEIDVCRIYKYPVTPVIINITPKILVIFIIYSL